MTANIDPLNDPGMHVAFIKSADEEDALQLLEAPQYANGRGPFKWITLANGDVLLACYPQGDLFETLLQKGAFT